MAHLGVGGVWLGVALGFNSLELLCSKQLMAEPCCRMRRLTPSRAIVKAIFLASALQYSSYVIRTHKHDGFGTLLNGRVP